MLSIFSFFGTDLVANPPAAIAVNATSPTGLQYTLQVLAVENDTTLPLQLVNVTIDWNDSQADSVFPYALTSNGTNTVNTIRTLGLGAHVIRVEAQNLRAPKPDVCAVNFDVTVLPAIQIAAPTPVLFGPILPKDNGFPNPQQWDFNTGYDLDVLASSVKMLLSTAKGERIMLPDYGTNLRSIIFEAVTQDMQAMAQTQIVDALNTWEPRVTLQSILVTKTSDTSITLTCTLVSKLSQQTFVTSTVFNP